jgi:hypothetical protein
MLVLTLSGYLASLLEYMAEKEASCRLACASRSCGCCCWLADGLSEFWAATCFCSQHLLYARREEDEEEAHAALAIYETAHTPAPAAPWSSFH